VQRLCDAEKLSRVEASKPAGDRALAAGRWAWANIQGPAREGLLSLGPVPAKQKGKLLRTFAAEHEVKTCALADLLDAAAAAAP
jgi:hypothetical protein